MAKDSLEEQLKKEGFKKMEPGDVWDFEKDKVMRGVFLDKEEGVGPNNSNLYNFEVEGGRKVAVWGSTIIDTRLKNVVMGEEVVIVYHGKVPSEKRKGSEYKNFEVYHKKLEEEPPHVEEEK